MPRLSTTEPYRPLTDGFYEQPRIIYPDTQVLGMLVSSPLDCMIQIESGGNPEAYNPKDTDGRPKYGLLQFDSRTFKGYCVDRYELPDDLWNPDIQVECTNRMLNDGFGYHWPSYNKCL